MLLPRWLTTVFMFYDDCSSWSAIYCSLITKQKEKVSSHNSSSFTSIFLHIYMFRAFLFLHLMSWSPPSSHNMLHYMRLWYFHSISVSFPGIHTYQWAGSGPTLCCCLETLKHKRMIFYLIVSFKLKSQISLYFSQVNSW